MRIILRFAVSYWGVRRNGLQNPIFSITKACLRALKPPRRALEPSATDWAIPMTRRAGPRNGTSLRNITPSKVRRPLLDDERLEHVALLHQSRHFR